MSYEVSSYVMDRDYLKRRSQLFQEDSETQIGFDIKLSKKELKVNALLVDLKKKELDFAFSTGRSLQEANFVLAREKIKQSDVYRFIRKMPKGAVHHIHGMSMASYAAVIKKWTYNDICFVCYNHTLEILKFKISNIKPKDIPKDTCRWMLAAEARKNYTSSEDFDAMLLSFLTFQKDDILKLKNQDDLWKKFQNVFSTISGLVTYEEIFEDYFYSGLQELVEDNVQFVEVRALLPPLYFLNGTTTKGVRETLETYIKVANKFISEHSDHFYAAKYIYSVRRFLPRETIKQNVLDAIDMVERYPNHLIGFDLVGQEDTGRSLFYYIDELLTPKHLGKHLPYIFHAGETDWEGRSIDQNLFDAILLNTSRIGHGYAITKHPTLRRYTKENKVAIELCPISNQILGLVSDLRDHPAADLLSDNQPITVSPDDPAIWQASGVSFDLYQVFMAMTPAHAGLQVLKKLALNSISYSSVNESERFSLMEMWKRRWEIFLDDIILEYQL